MSRWLEGDFIQNKWIFLAFPKRDIAIAWESAESLR